MSTRLASSIVLWLSALFLTSTLAASTAVAQTYVAGPVSGVWTAAGNPYVATDTLLVLAESELLIEAGVEVIFDGSYALMVQGKLSAAGAHGDSITFHSPPGTPTTWCGIRFLSADPGCYLQYCRILNCQITGQTQDAACGGGVYAQDTVLSIAHCHFESCHASSDGYLEDGGGAIFCQGGEVDLVYNRINDCSTNSFCTGGGGGIGFRNSDITILGNVISDCNAHGFGGGIAGAASQVEIAHNVITGCSGFHYGGGIALKEGCGGRIFNNLVLANTAADTRGGGIYLRGSNVQVVSCTVVENTAGTGGFGQGGGLAVYDGPDPLVSDCIFWGNSAVEGPQIWPTNLWTVDYCDVQGGYLTGYNLDQDPLFVTGPDEEIPADYYLSAVAAGQDNDSPCIEWGSQSAANAGLDLRTTRTDLVADMGIVDLGYHYLVSPVTPVPDLSLRLILAQNSPNPFNPKTVIRFELAVEMQVKLAIFDLSGRRITTLSEELLPAGSHQRAWAGLDRHGLPVSSGVYLYRLEAGGQSIIRSLVLLK